MEKSQFVMGKSTISMAILNSYVCLPEGIGARSSGKRCAVSTCYVDENQSFQQQGLHETQQALLFVGNLLVAYVPFFTAILILSCFLVVLSDWENDALLWNPTSAKIHHAFLRSATDGSR